MSQLSLLFNQALNARQNAYAPYSHFAVGAAVLSANGKIYAGCNVENISYPCGTCAEAGAIAAMNADGGRLIKDIVVVADGDSLISPCGACLQRIYEFADAETTVHLADLTGIKQSLKITELLPVSFNEGSLK
ncbi:MAG: cytidine deaminase [Alphaproteobacteria bacterium]|nr:cytidine deaminase [Alphaproteobacteria bacterium]